jgi:apolipoprotein N-acyltransferase
VRAGLTAFVAGLLVAAALPPWGWWPLAIVGVAVFETSLGEFPTARQRLARGWLFGAGWLFPGMIWMWFLTAPGYLVAAALFAGFHAVAAWAAPRGPWRAIGRPAAHTIAEAVRFVTPFGGVPLASLAVGQAAGPFVGVVRIGGALLLTWFVFQVGFSLAGPSPVVPQMARRRGVRARGEWHGVAGLAVALLLWAVSPLASGEVGQDVKAMGLRVAAVQGGGPQGTHAIHTDPREVVERHLAATRTIEAGSVDLVVWPENVVDVYRFADSVERTEIATEAARIGAPIAVGITEDTDDDRFINAQVIVTPAGEVTSRYEKVRRVPFGEYMPLRGLLHALGAPTDLVPRDAVEGSGPAVLDLPDGTRLAVAISWEVFFGPRVADGVDRGASLIINPTNGSSYTWTVLQSQQIASSRLRAIEQNRWVVQVAPTGFSAFVSPGGDVFDRTAVSEQRVIIRSIDLRGFHTWYSYLGDGVVALVMLLVFAGAWHVPGRAWWARRRRDVEAEPRPPDPR